jgi:hypothetical protein
MAFVDEFQQAKTLILEAVRQIEEQVGHLGRALEFDDQGERDVEAAAAAHQGLSTPLNNLSDAVAALKALSPPAELLPGSVLSEPVSEEQAGEFSSVGAGAEPAKAPAKKAEKKPEKKPAAAAGKPARKG